jgi:hypothetical protein
MLSLCLNLDLTCAPGVVGRSSSFSWEVKIHFRVRYLARNLACVPFWSSCPFVNLRCNKGGRFSTPTYSIGRWRRLIPTLPGICRLCGMPCCLVMPRTWIFLDYGAAWLGWGRLVHCRPSSMGRWPLGDAYSIQLLDSSSVRPYYRSTEANTPNHSFYSHFSAMVEHSPNGRPSWEHCLIISMLVY